jgi:hypothetical protein
MPMWRPALIACLAACLGAGCAADRPARDAEASAPIAEPVDPAPMIERHNARVARLGRVWARGIVAVRYTDADGDRRYEQGDSHLQRLDGDKLALSVTKLGETYFWFGADETDYWVFDLTTDDRRTLYRGRLDLASPEKAAAGLPVLPSDWLHLAGLRSIDAPPAACRATRDADGAIALEVPRGSAASWRFEFTGAEAPPSRIDLLDADRRPILTSTLDGYRSVIITGEGSGYPKMPSRIRLEHVPSESSVNVVIDGDPIDGRRVGKPKARVFDLEFLTDALGPIDRVVDLDAPETVQR